MSRIKNVKDLFIYEIQHLHKTEEFIIKQLNSFTKKTKHPSVKNALTHYQSVTEKHKKRLEKIQELFEETNAGAVNDSKVIPSLTDDASTLLSMTHSEEMTDSIILSSLQKISYFKIACYRSTITYTKKLSIAKAKDILSEALNEEYDENNLLTQLSEVILPGSEEGNQQQENLMPGKRGENIHANMKDVDNTDQEVDQGWSTHNIQSPGGRAGTSHRGYPGGESRGH